MEATGSPLGRKLAFVVHFAAIGRTEQSDKLGFIIQDANPKVCHCEAARGRRGNLLRKLYDDTTLSIGG